MNDAQRAATHELLFAILACKASITPEIQERADRLSRRMRMDDMGLGALGKMFG